ncbi:MAG: hypothetical protein EXR77_00715 [Myxococcales bacterium]|nr:hypothetical protein [Myxococcales bacterium]
MRQPTLLIVPVLISTLFACSPTQNFGSVEGLTCSRSGDQVCSKEPGNPRARCGFDNNWTILEKCNELPCVVVTLSGGLHSTSCGGTPSEIQTDVVTTRQPDTISTSDTSEDSNRSSDIKPEGKDAISGTSATNCGSYVCSAKQLCTLGGACEDNACASPCGHGERCSLGVCLSYCSGTCASTEYCPPDPLGDQCQKLNCTPPMDLGAAFVAVDLQAQATADSQACAHLAGATLTLNNALQAVGLGGDGLAGGIALGADTLTIATLPVQGSAVLLAKKANSKPCAATGVCGVVLSKADNLNPAGAAAQPCKPRYAVNKSDRFEVLPLPLRLGTIRVPLFVRNAAVMVAADSKSAELCGHVAKADIDVALSGLSKASGTAFQLLQKLVTSGPDVDSNGDGTKDVWAVRFVVQLAPAVLNKWAP